MRWLVQLGTPVLGAALVALASRSERLYRLLVQEDAILEWGQVVAYGSVVAIAVVAAPRLWRLGDHVSVTVVLALAMISLASVGEELSWGQRLFDFETPDIAANNVQGEFTLHNDARFEQPIRVGLLLAGLYGVLAPLVIRRSTPLVPPRRLVAFFAVVVAYFSVRLLFLDHPSYLEAKYSEWPEMCFAVALLLWCADISSRRGCHRTPPLTSARPFGALVGRRGAGWPPALRMELSRSHRARRGHVEPGPRRE